MYDYYFVIKMFDIHFKNVEDYRFFKIYLKNSIFLQLNVNY